MSACVTLKIGGVMKLRLIMTGFALALAGLTGEARATATMCPGGHEGPTGSGVPTTCVFYTVSGSDYVQCTNDKTSQVVCTSLQQCTPSGYTSPTTIHYDHGIISGSTVTVNNVLICASTGP